MGGPKLGREPGRVSTVPPYVCANRGTGSSAEQQELILAALSLSLSHSLRLSLSRPPSLSTSPANVGTSSLAGDSCAGERMDKGTGIVVYGRGGSGRHGAGVVFSFGGGERLCA